MYKRNNLLDLLDKANYKNADLENNSVLVRSCLNVPLDDEGHIQDDTRIIEALPLIKDLANKAKRVVILAHLGRPEGYDLSCSLRPVKDSLETHLGENVTLVDDLNSDWRNEAEDYVSGKRVFLVENIRFFDDENSKDLDEQKSFAKKLSSLGDIFINDAFPDYRESPSTYYLAEFLPSYLGPAFHKEISEFAKLTSQEKPFVAVMGGAKLSEKIDVLLSLGEIADKILVGGAMAYTLLSAQGFAIGKSLLEADKIETAKKILEKYSEKIVLPIDHLLVDEFKEPEKAEMYSIVDDVNIPEDKMAVDIGPKTIEIFKQIIGEAKTIVWNGPMGVFEWDLAGKETKEVGESIAKNLQAYKLAGGGDSISAINKFNISGFDHISTGGGAMLAFLSYETFGTLDVILDQHK